MTQTIGLYVCQYETGDIHTVSTLQKGQHHIGTVYKKRRSRGFEPTQNKQHSLAVRVIMWAHVR